MAYHTQYQGTSVKDFLNTEWEEISKMNKKELWDFTRQTVIAANKRVANMEKAFNGVLSPGVQKFVDAGGGKISIKDKRQKMLTQIANLQYLMSPPAPDKLSSRSVKDYKKYLKFYSEKLSEMNFTLNDTKVEYANLPEEYRRSLWAYIDSARSQSGGKGTSKELGSDAFIRTFTEEWITRGQFHFERGQDVSTVMTEPEFRAKEDEAWARFEAQVRQEKKEAGITDDFDSYKKQE